MTSKLPSEQRRGFLGSVAAATAVALGSAAAIPAAAAAETAAAASSGTDFERWLDTIPGKHRQIYDAPEPHDGMPLMWSHVFLMTGAQAYAVPESELGVVLVLRHAALPLALNDSIWAKYKFGEFYKIEDPQTKAPDEPWYGSFRVRPKLFETAVLGNFVRNVLTPDPGTLVSGFKEIRYSRFFVQKADFAPYMDFLLAKFPGAQIVFNTRSAEDVAKSSFLARENPDVVRAWVAEADENFARYALRSDRTMLMRYDDYTRDHAHVHRMLDFLRWTGTPRWSSGCSPSPSPMPNPPRFTQIGRENRFTLFPDLL